MPNTKRRKSNDPCWKGYEQAGTKTKGGKKVPNCIKSSNSKRSKSK